MQINHSIGYQRHSTSPVIDRGSSGQWDDLQVCGGAPFEEDGVIYVFYAGGRNSSFPKLTTSIGLATSTDGGDTFTKQGIVFDKSLIPTNHLGLAPFSVIKIDGTYYVFGTYYEYSGSYKMYYISATDLYGPWSYPTFLTGTGITTFDHAPWVMEDPNDADKLLLYYGDASSGKFRIARFEGTKSDPSVWTNKKVVLTDPVACLYPTVRYEDGRYTMIYARKPAADTANYLLYKSTSLDGESFPFSNLVVMPYGATGAFDSSYTTMPAFLGSDIYYCGRKTGVDYYIGIGRTKLSAINGAIEWDFVEAGTGPIVLPGTYGDGLQLVPGSKGNPRAWIHTRGYGTYEAVVYDNMNTGDSLQNTLRITDENIIGPLVGIWNGTSKTKYIYRTTTGSWAISSVDRSLGLHTLTMEVLPTGITMKIDGVTVATDTTFDASGYFRACLSGYYKSGASGLATGYVKSLTFTPA